MNEKIRILLILVVFFIFSNIAVFADINTSIPNEVLIKADESLEILKGSLLQNYEIYGLSSVNELQDLHIAYGYKIEYFDVEKVMESDGKNIINLINKDSNKHKIWEFILVAHDEPLVSIRIADIDGVYKLIEYSGDGVAKTVDNGMKQFENLTKNKNLKGSKMIILSANEYYIVGYDALEEYAIKTTFVKTDSDGKIIFQDFELLSSDDIIDKLQKQIRYNKNDSAILKAGGNGNEMNLQTVVITISIVMVSGLVFFILNKRSCKKNSIN